MTPKKLTKKINILVVSSSDTIIKPDAMMIESINTSITSSTMFGATHHMSITKNTKMSEFSLKYFSIHH